MESWRSELRTPHGTTVYGLMGVRYVEVQYEQHHALIQWWSELRTPAGTMDSWGLDMYSGTV